MSFEEHLEMLSDAAANPETTIAAVDRVALFVKQFEQMFETLKPDDDDEAGALYQDLIEEFLAEWIEG